MSAVWTKHEPHPHHARAQGTHNLERVRWISTLEFMKTILVIFFLSVQSSYSGNSELAATACHPRALLKIYVYG